MKIAYLNSNLATSNEYFMKIPDKPLTHPERSDMEAAVRTDCFTVDNKMIIMKFGGKCVRTVEEIKKSAALVMKANHPPCVVLSAIASTTNELIRVAKVACEQKILDVSFILASHLEICHGLNLPKSVCEDVEKKISVDIFELLNGISLLGELTSRTMDLVMSYGERLSIKIFSAYLRTQGFNAKEINSCSMGLITSKGNGSDSKIFSEIEVLPESYGNINKHIQQLLSAERDCIPVITGFIGLNLDNEVVTFGRSGSDYTAAIVGSALKALEIQIWSDVDGVLSADPKQIEGARLIDRLTFEEAAELAYFGAKILHPRTMQPAKLRNIPLRVMNSSNPECEGTLITSEKSKVYRQVTAITCKKPVMIITITATQMLGSYGFLASIFSIFARFKLSIDVIATSEVSISLTLDPGTSFFNLEDIAKTLDEIGAEMETKDSMGILSILGDANSAVKTLQDACLVLHESGVNFELISFGSSKLNLSIVISAEECDSMMKRLHEKFFP